MTINDATSPRLQAWVEEFERLVAEASDRMQRGELRPALASLAAIPPVHTLLVQACGELIDDTDVAVNAVSTGQYL